MFGGGGEIRTPAPSEGSRSVVSDSSDPMDCSQPYKFLKNFKEFTCLIILMNQKDELFQ